MNTDQIWGKSYVPCIKNRLQLILQPEPQEIVELNQQLFLSHTKHWLKKFDFIPIIRYYDSKTLFIKVYYSERFGEFNRHIEDFVNSFYTNFIKNITFKEINILGIPFQYDFPIEKKTECQHYKVQELILLSSLKSSNWVSCNLNGEGGVTVRSRWTLRDFYLWSNLLDQGFLSSDYEDRVVKEELSLPTNSATRTTDANSDPSQGNHPIVCGESESSLSLLKKIYFRKFERFESDQPSGNDAFEIDWYFKENFAKVWAISHGFLPTFTGYSEGTIKFEILKDQRFDGDLFVLCRWLATEYRSKTTILKDAVRFEADILTVNTDIGFLYNPTLSDEEFVDSYDNAYQSRYKPVIVLKQQNYGIIKEPIA